MQRLLPVATLPFFLRRNTHFTPISLITMFLTDTSNSYTYIKPQKLTLSTYTPLFHFSQWLYSKNLERIYYTKIFITKNFI